MEAQAEIALLASPPAPATPILITVSSAWLSELPPHLNFTFSPACLGYRNSHSHFTDEEIQV